MLFAKYCFLFMALTVLKVVVEDSPNCRRLYGSKIPVQPNKKYDLSIINIVHRHNRMSP